MHFSGIRMKIAFTYDHEVIYAKRTSFFPRRFHSRDLVTMYIQIQFWDCSNRINWFEHSTSFSSFPTSFPSFSTSFPSSSPFSSSFFFCATSSLFFVFLSRRCFLLETSDGDAYRWQSMSEYDTYLRYHDEIDRMHSMKAIFWRCLWMISRNDRKVFVYLITGKASLLLSPFPC